MNRHDPTGKLYRVLTLREIDYLDILRNKSTPMYDKILEKIRKERMNDVDDGIEESDKLYRSKDSMAKDSMF